jgi:hypothetical protein
VKSTTATAPSPFSRSDSASRAARASTRGSAAPAERGAERELEAAGRRLYGALFRGPVEHLWLRSLGSLSGKTEAGLRLELRIDPASGPLRQLHGLPWELLHPPGRAEGFLCRHRRTTVVRHLELPRPRETPPLPSPLRVLLVAPSSAGAAPLDLDREVRELEAALAARADLRLRRLERPTLDALVAAFDEEPIHVLHFMGHGTFEAGSGRGSLVFEGAGGGAAPVAGEALAGQLADFVPPLRLVFLNACRTAEAAAGAPSGFLGNTLRFRFGGETLSVHLVSLDRDAGTVQVRVARSESRAERSW